MLGVSRMRCCNWRLGLNPYMQARVVWAMDYLISSTPLNFSSAKEPSSPLSPLPPRITCCVPPACPELLALLPTHPCSQCSARRACARHKYVIFCYFSPDIWIQFQVSHIALFVPGSLPPGTQLLWNKSWGAESGCLLLVADVMSVHPDWQACVGRVLGMGFWL